MIRKCQHLPAFINQKYRNYILCKCKVTTFSRICHQIDKETK